LRRWGAEEAALRLGDGNEVVAAGRSRHQARACEVLEALARLAQAGDELAMRTAVQIFLPRLAALVDTYWRRGLDPEERAAMVAAIAGEEVARCVPGEARTPFDFRLWSNIRRRFGRQVAAHGRAVDRLVLAEEAELERSAGDRHQPDVDERDLVALCWWVAELASVDHATARLIVLTRAAGVEIADLATAENLTPATLRKRRSRAEAKLRSALARHHDQREVERCA
jgi:hypothetical protein